MAIDAIKFGLQSLGPIQKPSSVQGQGLEGLDKSKKADFSKIFSDAIKEVDGMQVEADKQIEGMTLGKEGVTTHGAMLALEKADIAFQLMSTIRSKIIRAYEEVIRTQV